MQGYKVVMMDSAAKELRKIQLQRLITKHAQLCYICQKSRILHISASQHKEVYLIILGSRMMKVHI